MVRFLRFLLGILLIPFAIGITFTFCQSLLAIEYFDFNLHVFLWGVFLYMLMHLLLFEPSYIYSLGHEVIHVLAVWLCGGQVKKFQVSSQGGTVTTTRDNFFISISPYLIPTYTILLIIIFPIIKTVKFFYKLPLKDWMFTLLLGFTLALHIIMTVRTLKVKQPDIIKFGILFSAVLVYVTNLIIAFLILGLILEMKSIGTFFQTAVMVSKYIYIYLFNKAWAIFIK